MAAETGFLIEGTIYEAPTIDSLTIDENATLHDYTGYSQEDFIPALTPEEEAELERRLKHPYFFTALAHIAYQREHPELKPADIKALLGGTNRADMLSTLVTDEPEEASVPLDVTSEPDKQSERNSEKVRSISGPASENESASSVNGLHRIGATKSATSSPVSPPTTSAA